MTKSPPHLSLIDILRGIACLTVFNVHIIGHLTSNSLWAYGAEDIRTAVQLPFIRLWFIGDSAVAIFFVISGYVQSYRPFWHAYHNKDVNEALRGMTSSIFRRAIRLYLPVLAIMLICAVASYIGLFETARRNYGETNELYFLQEMLPPRFDTFSEQIVDVVRVFLDMMKFGVWAPNDPLTGNLYDNHTWTIPVEFHTSMVLYLVLMVTVRMKYKYTLLTHGVLMLYALYCDRSEIVCFIAGSTLCADQVTQLNTSTRIRTSAQKTHTKPNEATRPTFKQHSTLKNNSNRWLLCISLIIGLYLLSAPGRQCHHDPFYNNLNSLLPSKSHDDAAHMRSAGAIIILWALLRVQSHSLPSHPSHTKPSRSSSYLSTFGKSSFSFYLSHGLVIRLLFFSLIPYIYAYTGDGTYDGQDEWGTVIAWLIGLGVCFPPSVFLARVFYRWVEGPSLRVGGWLEEVVFEDFGDGKRGREG